MKKLVLTLVLLMFCSAAIAQVDPEALKARHDELIKKYGDAKFFEGKHCFKPFLGTVWSIYALEQEKLACVYTKVKVMEKEKEVYAIVKCTCGEGTFSFDWVVKLLQDNSTTTLGYTETYTKNERGTGYNFTINKETSDSRVDWGCVIGCATGIPECVSCVYNNWGDWWAMISSCTGPCATVIGCIWKCF